MAWKEPPARDSRETRAPGASQPARRSILTCQDGMASNETTGETRMRPSGLADDSAAVWSAMSEPMDSPIQMKRAEG